jgi:hypothetical protein
MITRVPHKRRAGRSRSEGGDMRREARTAGFLLLFSLFLFCGAVD